MTLEIIKLSGSEVRTCLASKTPEQLRSECQALQVAVYAMVGGGWLGRSATEQPKDFYIDDRVSKLPYSRKAIRQAVSVLVLYAEALGLNPHDMPKMINFHNCGIF